MLDPHISAGPFVAWAMRSRITRLSLRFLSSVMPLRNLSTLRSVTFVLSSATVCSLEIIRRDRRRPGRPGWRTPDGDPKMRWREVYQKRSGCVKECGWLFVYADRCRKPADRSGQIERGYPGFEPLSPGFVLADLVERSDVNLPNRRTQTYHWPEACVRLGPGLV